MKTLLSKKVTPEVIEILRNGGLVSVPTETVYGLAGNALNEEAVQKIYDTKGRPEIKPLSVMVCGPSEIEQYCEEIPPAAISLAKTFWPGPLTIVLKSKEMIPQLVRAGGTTVGLRCPNHALTLDLLKRSKIPLAAPSANPSGLPSPRDAHTVMSYFEGCIEAVLDGGECAIGMESTIIDMSSTPYRIIRHGALEEIKILDALKNNMKIIGITGGSGCGKTTALNLLKEYGAVIIDCDQLYHEMLSNDDDLTNDIGSAFPEAVSNGIVDRKKLGSIVFQDPSSLLMLNAITHVHIRNRVDMLINSSAYNGKQVVAIDAAALIESGLAERCDWTVGILSTMENRLSRVMERDNITFQEAKLRIQAQNTDMFYIDNCDYIIENNSTQQEFVDKCNKLFSEVL